MSYKNVPQWMQDSRSEIQGQNDVVGLIIAEYIGAFVKRGFTQQEMGSLMAGAFLLPLEEVEKRIDALMSLCEDKEQGKKLCVFCVQKGQLFSNEDTDPCEIIGLLKEKYGTEAVKETLLNYPEILYVWKNSEVRNSPENGKNREKAEFILSECASVFPEI